MRRKKRAANPRQKATGTPRSKTVAKEIKRNIMISLPSRS